MRARPLLPLLAVTLSACAQNFYGSAAEWTHSDRAAIAADGIEELRLSSRQGPIRLEAGADDSIRVELRVGPALDPLGTTHTCDLGPYPPLVALEASGRRLRIATDLILPMACVAEWVIVQPAAVAAQADVTAGHVTVTGLAGGVRVRVSTGDITVRVTDGPVTAETGTGRVELIYDGGTFGEVTAETRAGSIGLFVNGNERTYQRALGAGDAIKLDGPETNALRVSVNVGDIVVRLGSAPPR